MRGSMQTWLSGMSADGFQIIATDQCCLFASKAQSPGLTCIKNLGLRQKKKKKLHLIGGKSAVLSLFPLFLYHILIFLYLPLRINTEWRWGEGRKCKESCSLWRMVRQGGWQDLSNSPAFHFGWWETRTGTYWDVETLAQPSAVLPSQKQDRLPRPGGQS